MISVIIPTYNRESTILRAIKSVINQTYTNIEILVIDDGSTDGTANIVNGIDDDRIKYIVLEKNGGSANARNIGVQMAEGNWIAFQDSDDCWHNDKLEIQMNYAKEHPEYFLIYCIYNAIVYDGEQFQVPPKPWPEVMEGDILDTLLVGNGIGAPTILVKKSAFISVGGFDTSYKCFEDWEFVIRFSKEYQIGFVKETLLDCYISNTGISSNTEAHYDARCKMLGQYKQEMIRAGVLECVVKDISLRALKAGVYKAVEQKINYYLNDFSEGNTEKQSKRRQDVLIPPIPKEYISYSEQEAAARTEEIYEEIGIMYKRVDVILDDYKKELIIC